jgi:hypothetical protein
MKALPPERELSPITELLDDRIVTRGCRYFSVSAPELDPRRGAIPYSMAEKMFPNQIKIRPSLHGKELFIDQPARELPKASLIAIVLGPPREYGLETGVIYTWHPGFPLAVYKEGEKPTGMTAVKIHNGV